MEASGWRIAAAALVTAALCLAGPEAAAQGAQHDAPAVEETRAVDYGDNDRFLDPVFEIEARAWQNDIDGETSLVRGLWGGKLELSDELGLDDDTSPELRLRWRFADRHALIARYVHLDYDSDRLIARPFIFDDELAGAFSRVETDLTLHYGRIGWRWTLLGDRSEEFSLGTILDVAIFDMDASYELYNPWNPFWAVDDDEVDGTVGLPLLGLEARWRPHACLEIFGEAAGMYAGDYGEAIDAEVGGRWYFTENFSVSGGYRAFMIDAEYDEDDNEWWNFWGDDEETADLDITGPFIGATFRF